jgi:hypothetical protein
MFLRDLIRHALGLAVCVCIGAALFVAAAHFMLSQAR